MSKTSYQTKYEEGHSILREKFKSLIEVQNSRNRNMRNRWSVRAGARGRTLVRHRWAMPVAGCAVCVCTCIITQVGKRQCQLSRYDEGLRNASHWVAMSTCSLVWLRPEGLGRALHCRGEALENSERPGDARAKATRGTCVKGKENSVLLLHKETANPSAAPIGNI